MYKTLRKCPLYSQTFLTFLILPAAMAIHPYQEHEGLSQRQDHSGNQHGDQDHEQAPQPQNEKTQL
jgi:hypothetical protein